MSNVRVLDDAVTGAWGRARQELIGIVLWDCVRCWRPLILDVGCGTGSTTAGLVWYGKVTGVEPVKEYRDVAKKNGIDCLDGTAERYPASCKKYDVITLFDVLEHCENDSLALREAKRHLKHDGVVILTVPAIQSLFGSADAYWGHLRRYNKRQLLHVASRAGLVPVECFYWNWLALPVIALYRLWYRDGPVRPMPAPKGLGGFVLYSLLCVENWLKESFNISGWRRLTLVMVLKHKKVKR